MITVSAPAKLNLHLGVHDEVDEQGYHRVDSLMVCVDVYDYVRISRRPEPADDADGLEHPGLTVVCTPDVGIPQEQNTCYHAAILLAEAFDCEDEVQQLIVSVEKNIPDQAGLGASSSDAAATLVGLCELWGIDAQDERVYSVAREVGADVPFFLVEAPAYLEGRGDIPVETFPKAGKLLKRLPLALIRPEGSGITAGGAYKEFDRKPVSHVSPDGIREALRGSSSGEVVCHMANNLEPVAFRLAPSLEELVDWAGELPGVVRSMVTGSGTCFFCVCESDEAAQEVVETARDNGLWSHVAHFIPGTVQVVGDAAGES